MISPPKNFFYNPALERLEWDPVQGAAKYKIIYQDDPLGSWKDLAIVSVPYCDFGLGSGTYSVKGQAEDEDSGEWGEWGDPETIIVT